MTHGATPAEWAAWQRLAEADLLPVVMDPAAVISSQSAMKDLGKTPSRYNAQGEAVGIPAWTAHHADARTVRRWTSDARLGLCVVARSVKAIDIDIDDKVRAREVEEFIEMGMGTLPRRWRANSGKSLLAFRLPVDFPKRVIKTPHGIIELLSTKQQFVACGTHKSGARIEWDGGVPAELPEITMAELDCCWQALIDTFALADGASVERVGMAPTTARQACDSTDPKVDWLEEQGQVTGFDRSGRVDVLCPWADGHSTDTGVTSTSYFPAGVGGFDVGHFRCLHASCAQRTNGDYDEATGYTASAFDVVVALSNDKALKAELPGFVRDLKGKIEPILNNMLAALRQPETCEHRLGFDEFKALRVVAGLDDTGWRAFTDDDYTRMRSVLEAKGFKPINPAVFREAVRLVSTEFAFDSAIDWIKTLVWDGVERIESFYPRYWGAKDTPYTRAVGTYTWTGLAGRCFEPGCKVDMVPVLTGAQGVGKTTGVKAMAPSPETFVEMTLDVREDDQARRMRGKLVGELGEMRGLDGRDADAIKQWLTRTTEEWRPLYQEFTSTFQRRLMFLGTTNRDDHLVDETGERRWLPMLVGDVDVPAIEADRDQLWAEGLARFLEAGVGWSGAYELAKAEHGAFKAHDVWQDAIRSWMYATDFEGQARDLSRVRVCDVLASALNIAVGQTTKAHEMRCGKALAAVGFTRKLLRIDGAPTKVWAWPEEELA
jgi:hypothetical protein